MCLIAFDGCDGAGKSTAAQDLYYQLNQLSGVQHPPKPKDSIIDSLPQKSSLVTKIFHQPGETKFGDEIRKIVKNHDIKASPYTQLYAFGAQYYEFCDQILKPIYEETQDSDRFLIVDRHPICSAYSYSVYTHNIPHFVYNNLYDSHIIRSYHPDIVLLFDISIDNALKRISKRPSEYPGTVDRFENKDNLIKAIQGYKELIHGGFLSEDKYIIINANVEKKYVYHEIIIKLLDHPVIKNHRVKPLLETILKEKT